MIPLRDIIKPGWRCLDGGANIGDKTEEMLDCGASYVCAVEPYARLVRQLRRRFTDRPVEVMPVALSDVANGIVPFYLCRKTPTISTLRAEWPDQSGFSSEGHHWMPINVRTLLLDDVWKQCGPFDYIKLDLEGGEPAALRGLTYEPRVISFEWRQRMNQDAGPCVESCLRIGLDTFRWHFCEGPLSEPLDADELLDALCDVTYDGDLGRVGDIYAFAEGYRV